MINDKALFTDRLAHAMWLDGDANLISLIIEKALSVKSESSRFFCRERRSQMRLRASLIFFSLTPSAMASAQVGSYVEPSYYESAPRSAIIEQYHDVLKVIRKEALNQQASDGGHLSYTHLKLIQHKIDDARRHYQNALWRIDN